MAELLSAGVFIEEIPSQVQVITAVSTSNVGAIGYTPRGPEDTATLVTSFAAFTRKFGPIDDKSFLGLSIAAFYANGGRRAFIVRVVPADAVAADVEIQSKTYNQEIETGDGSQTTFTQTAATSLLKDNDGASPLVPGSFSLRWRSAGTPVASDDLRNRDLDTDVALVNGQDAYEGWIDPKASLLVAGATSDGNILYTSVGDGRTDITIEHVGGGALDVSVVGNAITVTVVLASTTGTQAAAAVNADPEAALLVNAAAQGAGTGLLVAAGPTALAEGLPMFDSELERVVRGTASIIWNPDGGGDRTIAIPDDYATLTPEIYTAQVVAGVSLVNGETLVIDDGVNPLVTFEYNTGAASPGNVLIPYTGADADTLVATNTASAINGASNLSVSAVASGNRVLLVHGSGGSITLSETVTNVGYVVGTKFRFDHAKGVLSILFAGTDIPDGGASGDLRMGYTPTNGVTPTGPGNKTYHTANDDGAGAILGTDLVGSGNLNYADGSYGDPTPPGFQTTVAATPHDHGAILATYSINAWHLDPISRGEWGNDLRIDLSGNGDFFDASTGVYSRFDANILLRNTVGNFEVQETYEELSLSDPTATTYFADVINELSDLVSVVEPAGDEPPGQLSGVQRVVVIAGGDEDNASKNITGTLYGPPVAARTVSISYTDSTGAARTITDNGLGNFVGDIDAAGLNTITYANGSFDVTTLNSIQGGSLVVVSYSTAAEEATHVESRLTLRRNPDAPDQGRTLKLDGTNMVLESIQLPPSSESN